MMIKYYKNYAPPFAHEKGDISIENVEFPVLWGMGKWGINFNYDMYRLTLILHFGHRMLAMSYQKCEKWPMDIWEGVEHE